MSMKQSKSFFYFLLDKNTTKKQIQHVLMFPAHTHLESVIEVCYNLLVNNFLKLAPSLKSKIKSNSGIIKKFIQSKSLQVQKKILQKYFPLFYFIIIKSKQIILKALSK